MVGLPRSGKTTYARGLQEAGWTRVAPDDVRLALDRGAPSTRPRRSVLWHGAINDTGRQRVQPMRLHHLRQQTTRPPASS